MLNYVKLYIKAKNFWMTFVLVWYWNLFWNDIKYNVINIVLYLKH